MLLLFWSAVTAVLYTYVLFPVLVMVRGVLRPRPYLTADVTPSVSIVIAAHNERLVIGEKLENLLELDYPPELLEVVIASDGSDDGTDDVVRRYEARGVRLLPMPRQGKASALNAAVAASSGEILVFSDANSSYATDAVRALVRPFADSAVGGVAGNQRYLSTETNASTARGEQRYWSFDRLLKVAESRAGNTISATGAIYAVRRSLFHPVPAGVTDDFVTSTRVIAQGHRLVFAPDAVAYEPSAATGAAEFGRKVRVMTRGLWAVRTMSELLDPRRHGFYALQLLSHKVLRRLVVFPLLLCAVTSPVLWRRSLVYRLATLGQGAVYGAGVLGLLTARHPGPHRSLLSLPAFFCLVNAAALRASLHVLTGHRIDRWQPERASTTSAG